MKNHLRVIIALLLLARPCAWGRAASYGEGKIVHFDESEKSIDKRLELMDKKLDLTPDQQFRVKEALDQQTTKLEQLNKEVQEAKKKIADDTDGALRAVLTPSQQEKYQKIKKDIVP